MGAYNAAAATGLEPRVGTMMDSEHCGDVFAEGTVLVLAPTGKDARLLTEALIGSGLACRELESAETLTPEGMNSLGAILMAEEALTAEAVEHLRGLLDAQPPWSDLPLLVLVNGGRDTVESRQREHERLPLTQVTMLERPIRIGTLLGNVRFALRAREKQFLIRKNMEQWRLSEEALRKSEKLAVAGRLAASIAHEINNPLEAVTNLLYLIQPFAGNWRGEAVLRDCRV